MESLFLPLRKKAGVGNDEQQIRDLAVPDPALDQWGVRQDYLPFPGGIEPDHRGPGGTIAAPSADDPVHGGGCPANRGRRAAFCGKSETGDRQFLSKSLGAGDPENDIINLDIAELA